MSAYTIQSAGPYTITLPACPPACEYGVEYQVTKPHKPVTLFSADGKYINGSTSIVVPTGGSVCLVARTTLTGAGYWGDCDEPWYKRLWYWLFG